jgi:hypothetical protein
MKGLDPALLRAYLDRYRSIFQPVATVQAMENVNKLLLAGNLITQGVPYDRMVATDFMPRSFSLPKTH